MIAWDTQASRQLADRRDEHPQKFDKQLTGITRAITLALVTWFALIGAVTVIIWALEG